MTRKSIAIVVLTMFCTLCAAAKEHRRAYYDQFKDKTQVETHFFSPSRYGFVNVALWYECSGRQTECKVDWYNLTFTYRAPTWVFIDKKDDLHVEFLLDGKPADLGNEVKWDGRVLQSSDKLDTNQVTEEITVALNADNAKRLLSAQEVKVRIADGLGNLEFGHNKMETMQKSLAEPAEFKK